MNRELRRRHRHLWIVIVMTLLAGGVLAVNQPRQDRGVRPAIAAAPGLAASGDAVP